LIHLFAFIYIIAQVVKGKRRVKGKE
jgi:hypothetical protein